MTTTVDAFAAEPCADHSARFPLGQGRPAVMDAVRSEPAIRPWGLTGMRSARQQGDPVRDAFDYDDVRQVAVDGRGRLLVDAGPTAEKVTNNDGDEGPSEDFIHDFHPDSPYSV